MLAAVAACGAAFAVGCGGDEDDAEGAQEAAERYVEALKEDDGEAACDVLTSGAVDELEDRADAPCPEAIGVALGGEGADDLSGLRVTEVNAAEDVATATIAGGPSGRFTTELKREDGDWRLTAPGG